MGEAKRKKQAMKPLAADVELIAHAMRQVLGATTHAFGADCMAYALTGAEVLRRMGHDAKPVAGSAVWRVGAGVGDTLVHAKELYASSTGAFAPGEGPAGTGMFHAWIEVGTFIVDFTTFSFADKARQLDAQDGMTTTVKWCPDYLLVDRSSCSSLEAVPAGMKEGLYAYVRHERVERVVYGSEMEFDVGVHADMVQLAARGGKQTIVFGVGPDGVQGLEQARERSAKAGLKPVAPGDLLT